VFDHTLLPNAPHLKHFLNIGRDDPIHIDHLPIIDAAMQHHKLMVTGDYTYISPKKCAMEVRLVLQNGHYTVERSNRIVRYWNLKEKLPVVWKVEKDGYVRLYDGEKEWVEEHKK
jgi:hypothetical protein